MYIGNLLLFANLIALKKGFLKIVGISANVCSLNILFISYKVSLQCFAPLI